MKICMFLPRIDKKYKTKSVKYERKILSMCDSSISKTSERKKKRIKKEIKRPVTTLMEYYWLLFYQIKDMKMLKYRTDSALEFFVTLTCLNFYFLNFRMR